MSSVAILPGQGINKSLVLGNSLYNTITKLNELNQRLKIAYSSENYLATPILVTLPDLGVRLMFESNDTQQLVLIEILNFDHMKLTYNGNLLNDILYSTPSNDELTSSSGLDLLKDRKQVMLPKLKEIYHKIFGPTFPGELNLQKQTYTLSYPGIAFKFRLELRELVAKLSLLTNENDILSKLTNWDKAHEIPCESVAIFKGDDYRSFFKLLQKAKVPQMADLAIEKVSVTLSDGTAKLKFKDQPPATITIGKLTQQDILRLLGPPDGYFNKYDSRLLIHKHLEAAQMTGPNSGFVHKFHNYFRHGMDFLYNLNPPHQGGGVLEKIVLHNGGIADSLDFMQWNKCNWEMRALAETDEVVNSSMAFYEFSRDFLEEIDHDKTGPVCLNRNESEITNFDDLEVIYAQDLDKQVLFAQLLLSLVDSKPSNEYKTWGQLSLYGCKRCIWEIIETNNCVSRVTIY